MWQEIQTGDERLVVYRLNNSLDGILKAGFSCKIHDPRNIHNKTPIWMQKSNPAKLDALIEHERIRYKVGVEFYDQDKFEQEALIEQRKFLNDQYHQGECPPENDPRPTAQNLRAIMKSVEEAKNGYWIRFQSCQRTQKEGPKESNPDRQLEEIEIVIILPYIQTIIESMQDLQLREPFRSPTYYLNQVRSLMEKNKL